MVEFLIIISYILLFLLFICAYIYFRKDKVLEFRLYILDLSDKYESHRIKQGCVFVTHTHFKKLPGYVRMLFSFKKLKLENYFTEEEIKELKGE